MLLLRVFARVDAGEQVQDRLDAALWERRVADKQFPEDSGESLHMFGMLSFYFPLDCEAI